MQSHEIGESIARPSGGLLGGWISRTDLALQLGVSEDTLRRWEALLHKSGEGIHVVTPA